MGSGYDCDRFRHRHGLDGLEPLARRRDQGWGPEVGWGHGPVVGWADVAPPVVGEGQAAGLLGVASEGDGALAVQSVMEPAQAHQVPH